jgi:acetate kinase
MGRKMNVLVINSGSSSVKYKLFAMPEQRLLASGQVEGIGIGNAGKKAVLMHRSAQEDEVRQTFECRDHAAAVRRFFEVLSASDSAKPGRQTAVDLIGHRVVHGGSRFVSPVMLREDVIQDLERLSELAPLHLPNNVKCIRACAELLPKTRMAACFDTAFSHDMPDHARLYPVPLEWSRKYAIRRYGFHGISYEYVAGETSRLVGRPLEDLKIIAAHLGNGSSITALDRGRVVDTSMGFTPLEGLMMGTRSGNFDPAVFPYIMEKTGMDVPGILNVLNTGSGLLGVSGVSRDMRDIVAEMDRGTARAKLAFDMFVHVLRKYLGAYLFTLGGADAIVFTGGIGEKAWRVRQAVFSTLEPLGLVLDPEKNQAAAAPAACISAETSSAKLLVIAADEERMIARSVYRLAAG